MEGHTLGGFVPNNGLVGNQVDHSFEMFFFADGNLNGDGVGTQHVFDLLAYFEKVRALAVHFVYKTQTGYFVIVCETPVGFGLGLNPVNR